MHLASALTEQLGLLRVDSANQVVEQWSRRCSFSLNVGLSTQHPLIKAAHGVECQRPDVSFISDSTLQQANNRRFGFSPAVFERSGIGRHIGEATALSQKARDLDIGIQSILEFAIQLQEILVFE